MQVHVPWAFQYLWMLWRKKKKRENRISNKKREGGERERERETETDTDSPFTRCILSCVTLIADGTGNGRKLYCRRNSLLLKRDRYCSKIYLFNDTKNNNATRNFIYNIVLYHFRIKNYFFQSILKSAHMCHTVKNFTLFSKRKIHNNYSPKKYMNNWTCFLPKCNVPYQIKYCQLQFIGEIAKLNDLPHN